MANIATRIFARRWFWLSLAAIGYLIMREVAVELMLDPIVLLSPRGQ